MKHGRLLITALTLMGSLVVSEMVFAAQRTLLRTKGIGVDSSGGGNAIVCRHPVSGVITKATVLDLVEAELIDAHTIGPQKGTDEEIALRFVEKLGKLNPYGFSDGYIMTGPVPSIESILSDVLKNKRVLPSGTALAPIPDSFSPISLKGCATEQLAAYQPSGKLLIDGDIWTALDPLQRAALYVHEAVYKRMRYAGAKDSVRSRKIVGGLFAELLLEEVESPVLRDRELCVETGYSYDTGFKLAFFKGYNADGYLAYQFLIMDSQPVVSRRMADQLMGVSTEPKSVPGKYPFPNEYSLVGYTQSAFEGSDSIKMQIKRPGTPHAKIEQHLSLKNVFGLSGYNLEYDTVCSSYYSSKTPATP